MDISMNNRVDRDHFVVAVVTTLIRSHAHSIITVLNDVSISLQF